MARISVARFKIVGYRSCKNTEITLAPNITALIGANGAGKTNLLQAFTLFGQESSPLRGDNTHAQRCRAEVDFIYGRRLIQYRALIIYRSTESNRDEVLSFDEEWNFTGKRSSRVGWISTEIAALLPRKRHGRLYFSIPALVRSSKLKRSTLSNVLTLQKGGVSKKQRELEKDFGIVRRLAAFSNQIKYYGASQFTNPALSPVSFEIDEDGKLRQESVVRRSPHSKFLHDLYTLSKQSPEIYDLFLSFVDKR